MARLLPWVMMPSKWILNGGLRAFVWDRDVGSKNLAALMVLAPILHNMDRDSGISQLTYDQFEASTSLSRHKISDGISVLKARDIISDSGLGRSRYAVSNFDPQSGWAKFPAKSLYAGSSIRFFEELKLRKRTELDALKLWYLFAARRDNDVNLAKITYDQIVRETGIMRERIKSGLSLLAANAVIHVEHIPSRHSEYGVANAYRLPHLDSSRHMGTVGRGLTEYDDLR